MGLLERFGLARKPNRSRLGSFEIRRPPKATQRSLPREGVLLRAGVFAGLLVLTLLAFPQTERIDTISRARVGQIWQRAEVIAPFSFPVYKDAEVLRAERDSARAGVAPVFVRVPDAEARTAARVDSVAARLDEALGAYVAWQQRRAREPAGAAADSARYAAAVERVGLDLSPSQWDALLGSYAARAGGVTPTREPVRGPALHDALLAEVRAVAARLLPRGVLDVSKDSVLTPTVIVADLRERTEAAFDAEGLYGLDEAVTVARNDLSVEYVGREDTVALGVMLFERVLQPSLAYQRAETEARRAERAAGVSRTVGVVQQGAAIVRQGDTVTEEVQRQLASLARIRAEQQGGAGPLRLYAGKLILALAAFLIFFLYLYLLRWPIFAEARNVLLIAILFAAVVGLYGVAARLPTTPALAVPVGLASILLTVIFDSRVGMFATVALACLGGALFGYDFEFTFATVVAGMLAVFTIRDVRNRSQIVLTALVVFLGYAVMIGGFSLLRATSGELFRLELILVLVNSVLLLFTYPLLWVFERGFGVTTDLTLLELSDTNRPLLKELSLRAPGTFNHSLQVANLAEAAAAAVGCNALLTRIGALYHDIGKMIRPEYFIENQQPGENPHDKITPFMSALIIAEHVKAGDELGREHNLPEGVLDFIPTHHGTTLMEFFYRRAEELRDPDDPPVDEDEFRYPGPTPQTTEQGIVMLADSVEAASRSLEKPTPKKLEGLIDAIVRARVEDGQLDATGLTFADLDRIRETFLSLLSGVYHFRVKYPDQDRVTGEDEPAPAEAPAALPEKPEPAASQRGPQGPPPDERSPRVDAAAEAAEDTPVPRPDANGAVGPSNEERASLG